MPLIVHLDQKDWIALGRGYYGLDSEVESVAKLVVRASETEKAIFPLSVIHLDETLRRTDKDSRGRLAKFMVSVSKGWAILPAPRIIEPEIEDACLKRLGLQGYDLAKFAVKKGLSQLMGSKIDLVSSKPLPDGLKKLMLDKIESLETLQLVMEHGLSELENEKMRRDAKIASEKIEKIRLSQSAIKDQNLRHRATIARYLIDEINPKVISFLMEIRVNPKSFSNAFLTDQKQILGFFQSMPTSYCNVELSYRRDVLKERKTDPNDLNDIMSLSIALPYCDVVITYSRQ